MSGDERREAILKAAVPLFAQKGLHAVKTRELARAAGVSEALLFKHFASKEALYAAMQQHAHGAEERDPRAAAFLALAPSTDKLMLGLHLILSHMVQDTAPEQMVMPRLVLGSLLGDGGLAGLHFRRFERDWWPALAEALRAARKGGDALDVGAPDALLVWFFHHAGFAARVLRLPGEIIAYPVSPQAFVLHLARFLLRGMGVRHEVVRARYRPRALLKLLR
ncbi:MAG: TetR/AcrR family transcriptional regulator [Candidatus Lambdaproteobacteria bacterium]|nr:TetR/AcrR family transcriptional regulator [Candidatus Lambdaproteobacteria bacterium]